MVAKALNVIELEFHPTSSSQSGAFCIHARQGCPMVYFHTKNRLCIFSRFLEWKMLVYFNVTRNNLRPFSIFYGHLVYILLSFGTLFPVLVCCTKKNLATLMHA
jgi:hypothetical protein